MVFVVKYILYHFGVRCLSTIWRGASEIIFGRNLGDSGTSRITPDLIEPPGTATSTPAFQVAASLFKLPSRNSTNIHSLSLFVVYFFDI
jgi:hypothetical protein